MSEIIAPYGMQILITLATIAGLWIGGYVSILLLVRAVTRWLDPQYDTIDAVPQSTKIVSLAQTIVRQGGFFCLIILTANVIGINLSLLVGGIALGVTFALEQTMMNIVAAILLSTNPHIRQHECIFVAGEINMVGTIQNIGLRYTTIRGETNGLIIIANHLLIKQPIQRRMNTDVVRYDIKRSSDQSLDPHAIINESTARLRNYHGCTRPELTHVQLASISGGLCHFVGYCFGPPVSDIDNVDDHHEKPDPKADMLKIIHTLYREKQWTLTQHHVVLEGDRGAFVGASS